jgi:hypothetical protein
MKCGEAAMAGNGTDEPDLALRTTIELDTLPVEVCADASEVRATIPSRPHICTRSFWANHTTLLYRVALFMFLTLLITLLETLLPGKIGALANLLDTLMRHNVTVDKQ